MVIGIIVLCVGLGGCYFYYSRPFKETVETCGKAYGVDPYLIYAVMKVESKFDHLAISPRGAKGLMQIMDKTGAWVAELMGMSLYSHDKLFDPNINIQIGSWYLSRLLRQYKGDRNLVLAAYNAGSGNVGKWLKNRDYSKDGKTLQQIPFPETAAYIKKVNFHYKMYRFLYLY
jgi:soluble lytic murein transglycosylase